MNSVFFVSHGIFAFTFISLKLIQIVYTCACTCVCKRANAFLFLFKIHISRVLLFKPPKISCIRCISSHVTNHIKSLDLNSARFRTSNPATSYYRDSFALLKSIARFLFSFIIRFVWYFQNGFWVYSMTLTHRLIHSSIRSISASMYFCFWHAHTCLPCWHSYLFQLSQLFNKSLRTWTILCLRSNFLYWPCSICG